MNANQALSAYNDVGVRSAIDGASPHQLITMLLEGALDRIASAKGAMERKETARQGAPAWQGHHDYRQHARESGSPAGWRDRRASGLTVRLHGARLLEAGSSADTAGLDEVSGLLREIKTGWDGIPAEYRG
jgi:flagellar protein FliS